MSLFLDRNVNQNPNSIALLVFTQKSYPPAFLKNIALATDGVVDVGMITNPRDDLLQAFQIKSLPNIVIVYDTPEEMRPEDMKGNGKTLLGQAVYDTKSFGNFSFEGVIRFIYTCIRQGGLPIELEERIQMRLIEGLLEEDLEGFRAERYKKYQSGELGVDKEKDKDKKEKVFTGKLNKEEVENIAKGKISSSLAVLTFLDGYDSDSFDFWLNTKLPDSSSSSMSSKYWSAVHATCNEKFAKSFDVDIAMLPAVVAYSPKAKRFVRYLGASTEPKDLALWVDKVARGKVSTQSLLAPLVPSDFIDECVLDIEEDDGIDVDEMLREMREEEEEEKRLAAAAAEEEEQQEALAKAAAEEEEQSKKKKKKKKKRKKKKKKKKKLEAESESDEDDHIEL